MTTTRHGIPRVLDDVRRRASLRESADAMLRAAIDDAIAAGFTFDQVHEQVQHCKERPPRGANERYMEGWEFAKSGGVLTDDDNLGDQNVNGTDFWYGYHDFLVENS